MTGQILPPQDGGGYVNPRDHFNHLVIVTEVHSAAEEYDTKRKGNVLKMAVSFHCFNCEGLAAPQRVRLGAPHITSKVRTDGNLTLGRIEQLPPKQGFEDGAIVLTANYTDTDVTNALAWWESVKVSPIQGPVADPTPAAQDPWAVGAAPAQSAWGAAAPAAAAPASSPGAAWGTTAPPAAAPAVAAAPPSAPTPPAATAQPKPTFEQVQAMSLPAVVALVNAQVISAADARLAGHAVGG